MRVAAFAALLLLASVSGRCEYYQWTDKSGRVHWGNHPPEDAPSIKVERLKRTLSKDVPRVELYGTTWCGYCAKARQYMQAHGILYWEFDVEKSPTAADAAQALGWKGGIPFVVINGNAVEGYSPSEYSRLLPPVGVGDRRDRRDRGRDRGRTQLSNLTKQPSGIGDESSKRRLGETSCAHEPVQ